MYDSVPYPVISNVLIQKTVELISKKTEIYLYDAETSCQIIPSVQQYSPIHDNFIEDFFSDELRASGALIKIKVK